MDIVNLRKSPLHERHVAAGARFGEFGGWEMPLRYPEGSVAEHLKTRESVGIFDVSHLGIVRVKGGDAAASLNSILTNDLSRISVGRAQYTLLVSEDGGVVDDIIVWWIAPDDFWVLPNASNLEVVMNVLLDRCGSDCVRGCNGEMTLIAVQGPLWESVLDGGGIPSTVRPAHFEVRTNNEMTLAGTGYTGERGCEILLPSGDATRLWTQLCDAAETYGGGPAGLVARDTLRLEMGYPLHGHEMDSSVTPWESDLGWVVSLKKGDFLGRPTLELSKDNARWDLVGLEMLGREIPRSGYCVRTQGGGEGEVTSGNMSPVLGHGIALARVPPGSLQPGDPAEIDIRGKAAKAVCVKPPFIDR